MKLGASLAIGMMVLAGSAGAADKLALLPVPHHEIPAEPMIEITPVQSFGAPGQITYLSQLSPVQVVTGTDTTFWCDTASGCGPGVNLKRITAQQLGRYAISNMGASAPLSFNGSVMSLNFDSTLSVIGNQLHANAGGGGGGFPFVLGGSTIPGSSSVPTIASLQLVNSVLNGSVGGTPVYTATPSYTGLAPGTPVVCLGLDAGNHLITTPATGGVCGGGTPPTGGAALGISGTAVLGVSGTAALGVHS